MVCATVPAGAAVNSWPGSGALFSSTALLHRSVVAIASQRPSLICCNCYTFLMTTISLVQFMQGDTRWLTVVCNVVKLGLCHWWHWLSLMVFTYVLVIQGSYSNLEFQDTWKKPGIFKQLKNPGNGLGFRTSPGKPGMCVANCLTSRLQ